jgi:hypothetical protein
MTGAVSEVDTSINQFLYGNRRLSRGHRYNFLSITHSYGTQPITALGTGAQTVKVKVLLAGPNGRETKTALFYRKRENRQ